MPQNNAPVYVAGGTIAPSTFVSASTTADRTVTQSASGDVAVGISKKDMKRTPGLAGSDAAVAAETGDELQVYALGDECLLKCGSTWTAGALLKPNTNGDGTGIPASSADKYSARALEAVATGGFANVIIEFGVMP